jgi:uncharacterized protein (TIGR00255 family)
MIKSMTGYGRGEWQGDGKKLEVEIKSVNHRYCDIFLRLPRNLNPLETQAKNFLRQRISRGRVEVFVKAEESALAGQRLELDLDLARDYHTALKTLQENLGIPGQVQLETLAGFRDIFARKEVEPDLEKEWEFLRAALEGALSGLETMRLDEGLKLKEDFLARLSAIEKSAQEIEEKAPLALRASRDRLALRVQELSGALQIDEARLAQEVAFLADRSDITEELVRIRSHLAQFRDLVNRPEPAGRKLDFLLQEINREANTIGSKANDAAIAHVVVEIKSELEKVREQIQNVE